MTSLQDPPRRPSVWRRFQALPRDGNARTLLVSLAVCVVCSLVVSGAAVWLRPIHEEHLQRARRASILEVLSQQPELAAILGRMEADSIETHLIDLATGEEVPGVDPGSFDPRAAAEDPATSVEIPRKRDLADIERRALWAPVTIVRADDRIQSIVLPIHGAGYGGTVYGYLALEGDGNTILGISFYEHSETPGVGSEINAPFWRNLWRGKRVFDDAGAVRISVIEADAPAEGSAIHRVDAISGATRSSMGVEDMVRFWMGDDGFGPYLRRVRR